MGPSCFLHILNTVTFLLHKWVWQPKGLHPEIITLQSSHSWQIEDTKAPMAGRVTVSLHASTNTDCLSTDHICLGTEHVRYFTLSNIFLKVQVCNYYR